MPTEQAHRIDYFRKTHTHIYGTLIHERKERVFSEWNLEAYRVDITVTASPRFRCI